MKPLLLLMALCSLLRAEPDSMKILSSKITSSEEGGAVITFKIKNISDKPIQLGHEVGSKSKVDTNIRVVAARQDPTEGSLFMAHSPNLYAKACHGPQTFVSVGPGQVLPVQLRLDGGWVGKELALVLYRKDGSDRGFVAGSFVLPEQYAGAESADPKRGGTPGE